MRFLDYYPCKECNGTGKKLLLGRQVVDCDCCNGFKKHFPLVRHIERLHPDWPLCDGCYKYGVPVVNRQYGLCVFCERERQAKLKETIKARLHKDEWPKISFRQDANGDMFLVVKNKVATT